MNDEIKKEETPQAPGDAPQAAPVAGGNAAPRGRGRRPGRAGGGGRREGGDRGRRSRPGRERERSEFDQRTLVLRRVARVVAGGRRFSFSAAVVIGDRKGRVGVGIGKGTDTALSIEKATRDAKKNLITVSMTESMSIPHDATAKDSSGIVSVRPAPERGIVAGSSAKIVLELAGLKDVTAKILSPSKNKLNIARATVKALSTLRS